MSRKYGAKYDARLGTAQIAARIREDIRAEQEAGALSKELKVGVTMKRFSGGSSITLLVKAVPKAFRFVNAAHLKPPEPGERQPERYTSEGAALLRKLESIVSAYNYDGSDPMTDYFDVAFYKSIAYDQTLETHHRALAAWEAEHADASFCGQADPSAYCGKPLARGCDYHDHQFMTRETCWANSNELLAAVTKESERMRGPHAMLSRKEGGRP